MRGAIGAGRGVNVRPSGASLTSCEGAYLADAGHRDGLGRVHGEVLGEQRPPVTMVAVKVLLDKPWKVEVQAGAIMRSSSVVGNDLTRRAEDERRSPNGRRSCEGVVGGGDGRLYPAPPQGDMLDSLSEDADCDKRHDPPLPVPRVSRGRRLAR